MNEQLSFPLHLPELHLPDVERTSSGRNLEEALDARLAEDFLHEDWIHVNSWNDNEELAR